MDLMGGRKAGEMFLHSKTRPPQRSLAALLRRSPIVRIVMAASIIAITGGSDCNLHAGVDLMSERRGFVLTRRCEVRIGGGFASAMGGRASATRLRGSEARWEVNGEVSNLCMWMKIASQGLRGERERMMRGGGPESEEGLQEMLTADGDGWDAGRTEEQMANAHGGKIRSAYNFRHASHVSDFGRRGGVAASEGPGRGDDVVEGDLHARNQDQKKREKSLGGGWQEEDQGGPSAKQARFGGENSAAREWLPLVSGKGPASSMLIPRSRARKDAESETGRVVGVYRNTEMVGEAFRTPGRKPAYSARGGEAGTGRRRLESDNRGGSSMQALQGNYHRYYGMRRASVGGNTSQVVVGKQVSPGVWWDPRLGVLPSEWFQGKRCLDVGCNVGLMTMSMAHKFGAASMEGIDCDASLVARARKMKKAIRWPREASGPAKDRPRIYFRHADIVTDYENLLNATTTLGGGGAYDLLTCLSVTKWIHLNYGDDGLLRLFRACFGLLKEGGRLVIEPQNWRSYHRRRNVSNTTRHHYETIKIKPDMFPKVLEGEGFHTLSKIEPGQGLSQGFTRPIWSCIKGSAARVAPAVGD